MSKTLHSAIAGCLIFSLVTLFPAVKVQAAGLKGEIVEIAGKSVTLRLDSPGQFHIGDEVELTYMAGVLEMRVGIYRITGGKGELFKAQVISSSIPPDKEMKVLIYVRKGALEDDFERGIAYFYGDKGIPKDYVKAVSFFRKAAELGHAPAQNFMGIMYGDGLGVTRDDEEAVKWYCKSAEQGYAPGQYGLGVMYANGHGVPKDYLEAARLFRMSAEQGYLEAQYNLGVMYRRGWGVSQDYGMAMAWFRKAADQKLSAAQFAMGDMYEKGLGVEKDNLRALQWFRMAAAQGHSGAQKTLKERGLGW